MTPPATATPRFLFALAATLLAAQASGAEWRFDPTIEVGLMSDSNLRLDEGPDRARVAGGFASGRFAFRATTPLAQLSLTPRFEATHFPSDEDSDEDYFDRGVGGLWLRRWRTGFSRLQLDYEDAATVSGNRADANPDDGELGVPDDPGDSGALDADNRMRTFNARETLRFELTERDGLELSAGYLSRDFDEQEINEEVSFTAIGGTVGWSRQLRERTALGLRARVLRYNPELIPVVSNHYGLEAEWRYQVSERLDSYFRAGASRADFELAGGPAPEGHTAFIGGVGGSWQLRMSRVFLDLTRTVDPNSSGVTVSRAQARLRLDRDFTPRTRGSVAVRLISDEGPQGFNERRYAVASVGAEWRLTRAWAVRGRYDYSWQNYDLTPGSASSNALRLSVTFQPQRDVRDQGSLLE